MYPSRSVISLQGCGGCVAIFQTQMNLKQQGTTVILSSLANGKPFQHEIPFADFQALWDALRTVDLMALDDSYRDAWPLGAFNGTLHIEYSLGNADFSKTIVLAGVTTFDHAPEMQHVYETLTKFEYERRKLEEQH